MSLKRSCAVLSSLPSFIKYRVEFIEKDFASCVPLIQLVLLVSISRVLGLRVCGSEGLRSAPSFVLYRDVLTVKDFASWSFRCNSF